MSAQKLRGKGREERELAKTRTALGRIRVMATLDRELVERVDVLADLECRSRSQMVELLLLAGLPRWEEASTGAGARAALLGRAARRWT